MIQKIKFKTQEMAQSVASSLYNVKIDDCYLVCWNFDKAEFDFVIDFEGLSEDSYCFVDMVFVLEHTPKTVDRYSAQFLGYLLRIRLSNYPKLFVLPVSAPQILALPLLLPIRIKQISFEFVTDNRFAEFITIFLSTEESVPVVVLQKKVNKATLIVKNIETNATYFLSISFDEGQPSTQSHCTSFVVQFYPKDVLLQKPILPYS